MDALHDDDDRARALVVKTGEQRIREPLIGCGPLCFRQSVIRLERIIDDYDVSAATGQRATDRCRQAEPARGEFDLGLSDLEPPDPRVREGRSIPRRFEHCPELVAMLFV